MSDTPRTDAQPRRPAVGDATGYVVDADFARQLERENRTFRAAQKACEDCDAPSVDRIGQLERELAKEKEWHAMSKDAAIRVQRERDKLERELAALRFATARVEWKFGRNDDGTPKRWKEWDDLREALGEHVRQPQELARMIRHVEENPTVIPNMSQECQNCDTSGEHGTP